MHEVTDLGWHTPNQSGVCHFTHNVFPLGLFDANQCFHPDSRHQSLKFKSSSTLVGVSVEILHIRTN